MPTQEERTEARQRAKAAARAALRDPIAAELPVEVRAGLEGQESGVLGAGPGSGGIISDPEIRYLVIQYRCLGLSSRRVAKRLGIHHSTVSRFVKTPGYLAEFERRRGEITARIEENTRSMLQEIVIEAIQGKISDMRKSKNAFLRNKIRNELIALWREVSPTAGKGTTADRLRGVYERAISRKLENGTTVTEKYRLSGQATPSAPDSWPAPADDTAGGGPGAPADDSPSPAGGAQRPPALAGEVGGAGGDGGDSEGGV